MDGLSGHNVLTEVAGAIHSQVVAELAAIPQRLDKCINTIDYRHDRSEMSPHRDAIILSLQRSILPVWI